LVLAVVGGVGGVLASAGYWRRPGVGAGGVLAHGSAASVVAIVGLEAMAGRRNGFGRAV